MGMGVRISFALLLSIVVSVSHSLFGMRKRETASTVGHMHTRKIELVAIEFISMSNSTIFRFNSFLSIAFVSLHHSDFFCRARERERESERNGIVCIKIKRSLMLIVFLNRVFVCKSVVVRCIWNGTSGPSLRMKTIKEDTNSLMMWEVARKRKKKNTHTHIAIR